MVTDSVQGTQRTSHCVNCDGSGQLQENTVADNASKSGIGPINALTILAEAGDLRRFGHHRQFLKFCGMDLATIQSSTFHGQKKLSNTGMPDCTAPSGWQARSPLCSGPTAFETRSNALSPKTATTNICAAKRIAQSPPRWPVLFMGSSNMANLTCPFFEG